MIQTSLRHSENWALALPACHATHMLSSCANFTKILRAEKAMQRNMTWHLHCTHQSRSSLLLQRHQLDEAKDSCVRSSIFGNGAGGFELQQPSNCLLAIRHRCIVKPSLLHIIENHGPTLRGPSRQESAAVTEVVGLKKAFSTVSSLLELDGRGPFIENLAHTQWRCRHQIRSVSQ